VNRARTKPIDETATYRRVMSAEIILRVDISQAVIPGMYDT